MKLQSVKSGMIDIITANVQNISPLILLHIFVNFIKIEPFTVFFGVLTISHELMKLRSLND